MVRVRVTVRVTDVRKWTTPMKRHIPLDHGQGAVPPSLILHFNHWAYPGRWSFYIIHTPSYLHILEELPLLQAFLSRCFLSSACLLIPLCLSSPRSYVPRPYIFSVGLDFSLDVSKMPRWRMYISLLFLYVRSPCVKFDIRILRLYNNIAWA